MKRVAPLTAGLFATALCIAGLVSCGGSGTGDPGAPGADPSVSTVDFVDATERSGIRFTNRCGSSTLSVTRR